MLEFCKPSLEKLGKIWGFITKQTWPSFILAQELKLYFQNLIILALNTNINKKICFQTAGHKMKNAPIWFVSQLIFLPNIPSPKTSHTPFCLLLLPITYFLHCGGLHFSRCAAGPRDHAPPIVHAWCASPRHPLWSHKRQWVFLTHWCYENGIFHSSASKGFTICVFYFLSTCCMRARDEFLQLLLVCFVRAWAWWRGVC